mmetsp:Transcript_22930/g.22116  ORF Transcript_22930/g.22116 Transcript_22930/m.22116 type:complete len:88 (+) Transcript_22930:91-354(+)
MNLLIIVTINFQFYKGREQTGLVYTNNSLSASSMILKSLSAYTSLILHVADLPLFHGNSLQTAPTGTLVDHIQSPNPLKPSTGLAVV